AVGQEKDKASDVIVMFFAILFPRFVICFRILIAFADEIGGKRAIVVDVCFAVGQPDRIPEFFQLGLSSRGRQRIEITAQQFVFCRRIIRWRRQGQAVSGVGSEAEAKVIGLHATIFFAGLVS